MKATRRSFFGFLGAAPLAAKAAADDAVAKMAGVNTTGFASVYTQIPPSASGASMQGRTPASYARLLKDPKTRAELEHLFWREQSHVSLIDADIAVHRSFSLNAKIYYQRQRNVQRRIKDYEEGTRWGAVEVFFNDLFSGWR